MEFTASVENLLKVCDHAIGAVKSREITGAHLECFTIEAKEDGTRCLFGTNNEMSILAWTSATVKTPGTTLVKAKIFRNAIRSLSSDSEVMVKADRGKTSAKVSIKSGRVSFGLQTTTSQDPIPKPDEIETKEIGRELLRDLIDQTLYACASDQTRVNLCGIRFEPSGAGGLRLIATDGHRLASAEAKTGAFPEDFPGFTVPAKACSEIRKLLGEDETIEIGFDERRIVIRSSGNTVLTCQLISAEYPDYRQVVPEDSDGKLIVDRKSIIEALNRLKMLKSKTSGMALELNGTGAMVIRTMDPDVGEGSEQISVEWSTTGEAKLKIAFNHGYLIDACATFVGEKLQFGLKDPLSPGVITDPSQGENQKAVVMPMRM